MAQIVQESVSYLFIYTNEKTVYFTLLPHSFFFPRAFTELVSSPVSVNENSPSHCALRQHVRI